MTTPLCVIIENVNRLMIVDPLIRELLDTHQVSVVDRNLDWVHQDEDGMKKLVSLCIFILSRQRNRIIGSIEKKDTVLLAKALAEATSALFELTDKEPTDKARKLQEVLLSVQTGRALIDDSWASLSKIVKAVLYIVKSAPSVQS